jgi:hypothetical protein
MASSRKTILLLHAQTVFAKLFSFTHFTHIHLPSSHSFRIEDPEASLATPLNDRNEQRKLLITNRPELHFQTLSQIIITRSHTNPHKWLLELELVPQQPVVQPVPRDNSPIRQSDVRSPSLYFTVRHNN